MNSNTDWAIIFFSLLNKSPLMFFIAAQIFTYISDQKSF